MLYSASSSKFILYRKFNFSAKTTLEFGKGFYITNNKLSIVDSVFKAFSSNLVTIYSYNSI